MDDAEDRKTARERREMLYQAVALGEDVMRLADQLGLSIAALHVCQGVEMLREEAERLSSRPH